jgi:branched-chain amino acid transport system ATP-binding protein
MLTLRNVSAAYGAVQALHDVSLEVPDGSVVALLGANGAGKSTTLKTISGILHPTRGEIVFDGHSIARLSPAEIVRRGVVHCPEGRQVFPEFSVRENLLVGAYARGNRDQLDLVLEMFPALRTRLAQLAGTLSGGEQQMLAIGRALMAQPRLLMLDEPSLGLAPVIVEHIFDIIAGLRASGVAVLLVEQNAMLALELADWAYALSHGEIRLSSAAADMRDSDAIRQAYLGTSSSAGFTTPVAAALATPASAGHSSEGSSS